MAVAPNVVSIPSLVPKGGDGSSPHEITKSLKEERNHDTEESMRSNALHYNPTLVFAKI